MKAMVRLLSSIHWGLEPNILESLKGIVLRHINGEKLSRDEIDRVVAMRNDSGGGNDDDMMIVDGVAIVPIRGVIGKHMSAIEEMSNMGTSTGKIERDLRQALDSPRVQAIVLDIDSPGGDVNAVDNVANFISKADRQKPVVAYANGLMASCAYWLGSQARSVITNSTGMVGAIGVYTVIVDASEAYENMGYKVKVVKAGEYKAIGVRGTEVTKGQLSELQRQVDAIYDVFVEHVARGRGMKASEVAEVADGRVFVGAEAVKAGLADKIGDLDDAINAARSAIGKTNGAFPVAARSRAEVIQGETQMPEKIVEGGATGAASQAASQTEAPPLQIAGAVVGSAGGAGSVSTGNPALSTLDLTAIRQAGAQAERVRIDTLGKLAASCGKDAAWTRQHIEAGTTVEAAGQIVLQERMAENTPLRPAIQVGEDNNKSTIGIAIQDAILARVGMGPTDKKGFHDRANEFRGCSVIEMMKAHMIAYGLRPYGWSAEKIAKAAYHPAEYMQGAYQGFFGQGGVPGHSTSDFPYILENTVNKILRKAYDEAPFTWNNVFKQVTNKDFKDMKRIQLGAAPMPTRVYEGGEYTEFTVSETRETYGLVKYGKIFRHTWEMMVNDDLDAFSRIPRMMGAACQRLINRLCWERWVLLANGETMADGVVLFHATHLNLASAGALSVTTLGAARAAMRKQRGLANEIIGVVPTMLIVPPELETIADQLISSTVDPAKSNATPNPFNNRLRVVVEAQLGAEPSGTAELLGDSAVSWYLSADPNQHDVGELCFLEGNEAPFVEREEGFVTDGVAYKCRLVAAAKMIDHRAVYKNPGA